MRKLWITAVVLFWCSCNEKNSNPVNPGITGYSNLAVVTIAADYTSGNFSIMSLANGESYKSILPIHSDNSVRTFGKDIYILERLGKDNIIKVDGVTRKAQYQENLGAGINIQDIAFANDSKAFITSWQKKEIIVFDTKQGKPTGQIDLSDFCAYSKTDSAQKYPFMGPAIIAGSKLYVACQRLKSSVVNGTTTYVPADTSMIVIIDTGTNSVTGKIPLSKKNPVSLDCFLNKLYVSSAGGWLDPNDGGIECIDIDNSKNLGVLFTEKDLGGNNSNIVIVSQSKGYVAVGKNSADWTSYWTEIMPLDLSNNKILEKISGITDGFGGLARDDKFLYIGDRGLNSSGVTVVDINSDKVVDGPVSTGLPPNAISVIE
jgi:hypothetical protein